MSYDQTRASVVMWDYAYIGFPLIALLGLLEHDQLKITVILC